MGAPTVTMVIKMLAILYNAASTAPKVTVASPARYVRFHV